MVVSFLWPHHKGTKSTKEGTKDFAIDAKRDSIAAIRLRFARKAELLVLSFVFFASLW